MPIAPTPIQTAPTTTIEIRNMSKTDSNNNSVGDPGSVVIPILLSSTPPNNAIMAQDSGGLGWKFAALTLSADLGSDWNNAINYNVTTTQATAAGITVSGISGSPTRPIVILSRNILPGERITITHKPSNSSVCLGFLPGDVSQDGRFMAMDISGLNSWVGTSVGLSQPLWKTDINRDGVFDAKDVTRAGELLSSTTAPAIRFLPACPAPITVTPSSNQSQLAATLASLTSLLRTLQQSLAR